MRRVRVSDYARLVNVSVRQVWHWIEKGAIGATGSPRVERYGPKPIVVIVIDDDEALVPPTSTDTVPRNH